MPSTYDSAGFYRLAVLLLSVLAVAALLSGVRALRRRELHGWMPAGRTFALSGAGAQLVGAALSVSAAALAWLAWRNS